MWENHPITETTSLGQRESKVHIKVDQDGEKVVGTVEEPAFDKVGKEIPHTILFWEEMLLILSYEPLGKLLV